MVILDKLKSLFSKKKVLYVEDLPSYRPQSQPQNVTYAPSQYSLFDGEKYPGGFGVTQLFNMDYWTLRKRSAQLFRENLYARGLIRRLITNEINIGLAPEAMPDEKLIGQTEEWAQDWSETVETRFNLWGKNKGICAWDRQYTFGQIQVIARREAYIEGDILCVLRYNQITGLPAVQLISGSYVRTPLDWLNKVRKGHEVKHGVEFDKKGRVAAYWVKQRGEDELKRIPHRGEKSGRLISWLIFATDKRMEDVRGEPLLAIILQSLKEIDKYRDSVQRKATINALLAMFVEKTQDKPGTLPLTGAAIRKNSVTVEDGDNTQRDFKINSFTPGMVVEELQTGEKIVGFDNKGTDEKFGEFEKAVIQAIAWAHEIPPEILMLSFSSNYAASQAAVNEYKMALVRISEEWGDNFCQPIRVEHLISEVVSGKVSAPGFLDARRDPLQYDIYSAWISCDWYGATKPSTDVLKQVKGSAMLCEQGFSNRSRESRATTGTKFTTNVKRLKKENELLVDAARSLLELEQEFGTEAVNRVLKPARDSLPEEIKEEIEELIQ